MVRSSSAVEHDEASTRDPHRHHSSRRRAGLSALAGLAVAGAAYLVRWTAMAPLMGWVVAGGTFLVWTWWVVWPKDADETSRLAIREDPTRPIADALVLCAAVVAMLTIALVILRAGDSGGVQPLVRLVLGVLS